MSHHFRNCVFVMVMILSVFSCAAQTADSPRETKPNPVDQYESRGYVSDFAGMITPQVQSQLEMISKDLDQGTKTQVAFVTVVSLEGLAGKKFATQSANRWGVGHKGINRGILILLSKNDHQYRISIGLGLEDVPPDEKVDKLGQQTVPLLRKEEYGPALLHLAKRIREEILQYTRDQLNSQRRLMRELASLTPGVSGSARAVPLPENSIR